MMNDGSVMPRMHIPPAVSQPACWCGRTRAGAAGCSSLGRRTGPSPKVFTHDVRRDDDDDDGRPVGYSTYTTTHHALSRIRAWDCQLLSATRRRMMLLLVLPGSRILYSSSDVCLSVYQIVGSTLDWRRSLALALLEKSCPGICKASHPWSPNELPHVARASMNAQTDFCANLPFVNRAPECPPRCRMPLQRYIAPTHWSAHALVSIHSALMEAINADPGLHHRPPFVTSPRTRITTGWRK